CSPNRRATHPRTAEIRCCGGGRLTQRRAVRRTPSRQPKEPLMAIAHPTAAVPRAKAREHGSPGVVAVTLLVSLSLVVAVTVLYALWKFWPTDQVLASTSPQEVSMFGIHRDVSSDVRLFVVVALAGALGGLMHSTR